MNSMFYHVAKLFDISRMIYHIANMFLSYFYCDRVRNEVINKEQPLIIHRRKQIQTEWTGAFKQDNLEDTGARND